MMIITFCKKQFPIYRVNESSDVRNVTNISNQPPDEDHLFTPVREDTLLHSQSRGSSAMSFGNKLEEHGKRFEKFEFEVEIFFFFIKLILPLTTCLKLKNIQKGKLVGLIICSNQLWSKFLW